MDTGPCQMCMSKAILLTTSEAFSKGSKAKMNMVRISILITLNKIPVPKNQQNKMLVQTNTKHQAGF